MINEKNLNTDNPVIIPRASELYEKAEHGTPGVTGFLTPKEQYILSKIFKSPESGGLMYLWGGCLNTERKAAFFLPDYYLPQNSIEKNDITSYILEYASDFLTEKITPLRIKGSGYRNLNHRDYLGSILSLGIERDSIGDICITSPYEAVIFATSKITPFLLTALEKIGGDKIASINESVTIDPRFDTGRKFTEITVTAASPRLDCTVRALSNKGSREDAVSLIQSGQVELNYTQEYKPEKHLSQGDTLTIRGVGKFIIDSTSEETKRGRTKIKAKKYS